MNLKERTGKRIIELRQLTGESQQDVADAIGITRQTLNRYELGQRTANIDILKALAEHFDVSADYLLGLSNARTVKKDLQEICDEIGLSAASVEYLRRIKADANHEFTSSYSISFLNAILENNSTIFSVDVIANQFKNLLEAKKEFKQREKIYQEAEQKRKLSKQEAMNAYEVGNVFAQADAAEQEQLAAWKLSSTFNRLAEALADAELEQEAKRKYAEME